MEKLDFNKILFVHNKDMAFKIAMMFTNFGKIDLSTQESLFYAHKDCISEKINFLTFSEIYNEAQDYINNWILDLDNVTEELDWQIHRSKILTRFNLYKYCKFEKFVDFLKPNYPAEALMIANASIHFNNGIILSEKDNYKALSNLEGWNLWKNLIKFREGSFEEIQGNDIQLKELKKIITNRSNDDFYKKHSCVPSKDLLESVESIPKKLEIVFFNEQLNQELSLIGKIKKRLKI